jgi:hypothetical protein
MATWERAHARFVPAQGLAALMGQLALIIRGLKARRRFKLERRRFRTKRLSYLQRTYSVPARHSLPNAPNVQSHCTRALRPSNHARLFPARNVFPFPGVKHKFRHVGAKSDSTQWQLSGLRQF